MAPGRRPHKTDVLWGAVAEALVAAYALVSAKGKLTSFRPFSDVDGKDLIIDLAGGFKDLYLQVKCALHLDQYKRIDGTVRLHCDHIPSDPKLVYVFCLLDTRRIELTRIWVVPAAVFYRRAYRTEEANDMVQFNFDCRSGGDERWDEFEVTRLQLGPKLVELIQKANRLHRSRRMRGKLEGSWLRLAA